MANLTDAMSTKLEIPTPWDGDMMEPAFHAFVRFAAHNLTDLYVQECGPINLATDLLGSQIDKATGHDIAELQRFIDWCVVQFGTPEQVYGVEERL